MSQEKLKILPLGGLGEIGMNCLILEWGNDMVLLDCGIQFPDSRYVGVDLLTPDLAYVRSKIHKLRGVVVTHGHDDHIGAIPFLAQDTDLDVYATAFPQGLIQQKLSEFANLKEVRFHEVKNRVRFSVGAFHFDPIPVQHSIIESLAYAIETPEGVVVHTGDFKHDPNELVPGQVIGFEPFKDWAKKGVLLLLSDSTNAERAGHTLSEVDIAESFEQIFQRQKGRILVALFASNIRRIERFLLLAKRLGKKVALAGRSMHAYTKLAHALGTLNVPDDTLVLLENLHLYPDNQCVVLLTGSQAEPQSALVRIAQGTHKDFKVRAGDWVILSSRFIPGNERAITSMIDQLYRLGAEVTYESIERIHVSGHGFQEELLMMLEATRPKFFIPIHGEYRHLAMHSKLAQRSGVPAANIRVIENGQIVELDADSIGLGEKLTLQKGVVVEGGYMEGASDIFSQRLGLARTGIVFAVLVIHPKTGELLVPPRIAHYGLLLHKQTDREAIGAEAEAMVKTLYGEIKGRSDMEELLRLEVRRFFRKRASHKPVVIPLILNA